MKKYSHKHRDRTIKINIEKRQGYSTGIKKNKSGMGHGALAKWVNSQKDNGLDLHVKNFKVTINLPPVMNFSGEYDVTIKYINGIRMFTKAGRHRPSDHRLSRISFNNLKTISASAALVLTAEISRWDDYSTRKLLPETSGWDKDIYNKFKQLGYFDLFDNNPTIPLKEEELLTKIRLVKYIKGTSGDVPRRREVGQELEKIIGEKVPKWMFLSTGLQEAIVNVGHHAYPEKAKFNELDKYWYLTASFDQEANTIKIVFYDQGVGIPASLPSSSMKEQLLSWLSEHFPSVDKHEDKVLLKAAVAVSRSRTQEPDRGKGIPDMLEFIRQKENGYMSILSGKGLYKCAYNDGNEDIKSVGFNNPIEGTLIIWKVQLES